MGRIVVLVLLALLGSTGPVARAAERPLRALVFDHDDPHTQSHGLAAALVRAGFDVEVATPKSSPPAGRVDLVAVASFASEDESYARSVATRPDTVASFVKRGGVLIQFTQADQTESAPPFLPQPLVAVRSDGDLTVATVTAPEHPLVQGLTRHPQHPERLALPRIAGRAACWESLAWQEGFRVLVSAGPERDRFALLEAAVGKGRVVLSSWHIDKQERSDGGARLSDDERAFADRIFENLAVYVRSVRDGTAPDVVATPSAPPAAPSLGEPAPAAWRMALSDAVVYRRFDLSRVGPLRIDRRSDPFVLHGHQVARGQLESSDPRRSDLAAVLALRLPGGGATASDVQFDLTARDALPVRVSGRVACHTRADGAGVHVAATYVLSSVKRDGDVASVRDGTATVTALFDPAEGVLRTAQIDLDYDLVAPGAKRGDGITRVAESRAFRLERVQRHRYEGFHDDVDRAIERGAAWLAAKRRDDGRWDAHGDHDVGTTSLAVLTLLECDVPRDDPRVAPALAWILAQSPTRTYDRSLALLAVEKAFGDAATLPAEHAAWCRAQAEALEGAASQPGSWGYPNGGNDLQRFDTSNSQYAVLGLRAAARLGVDVAERTWLGVIRHFDSVRAEPEGKGGVALVREGDAIPDEARTTRDAQTVPDVAGFRYSTLHGHRKPWASMTCAGIASLAIARHQLGSSGLSAKEAERIEGLMVSAWAWLDRHYAVDRHPLHPDWGWHFYYLYSLERAALLHGIKRVGGKDWYFDGATELLARVEGDGRWAHGGASDLVDTCFALLFLKRATAPLTGR